MTQPNIDLHICLTASRGGAPLQLLLAVSFVESAVDYPLGFERIASTVRHTDDKSLRSTMSEITFNPRSTQGNLEKRDRRTAARQQRTILAY